MTTRVDEHKTHAAQGDAHAHDPHLAHHFATPRQQFESGKLGMWIFLATEVLMFGGLFCAYAVYRANHPEIFLAAHHYLDATLGGINTLILICSSLSMAWAVRAAQLDQHKTLVWCLAITLAGGFGFLGIKYFEYRHKLEMGLGPGVFYKPEHTDEHGVPVEAPLQTYDPTAVAGGGPAAPVIAPPPGEVPEVIDLQPPPAAEPVTPPPDAEPPADPDAPRIKPAPPGPAGLTITAGPVRAAPAVHDPANLRVFFSVYYLMTGLHGIHVIVGMGLIGWILVRATKHEFSHRYFAPVDLVGLYWHLVDLIWIFLFPLLYLIH